jgi:hypothetical protein
MWHIWERRGQYAGFWWESPWNRWEDGIRMDLGEIGCEGVEWIHLA